MSPKKQTDLDRIQGTWRVTALEMDGAAMPDNGFGDATITVRGTEFTSHGMGGSYAGSITLMPDKRPKAFDLAFTAGPPQGLTNRGIYKLSGHTWTICLATRADARPKVFATRADSGIALETLERDADESHASHASHTPGTNAPRIEHGEQPTAASGVATEIEGEWPMISAVIDGKPLAPDMVKWCKRVTHGNVTQILAGQQSMLDAEFVLDASHTPGRIDYVNRSGKNKGKTQAGIYELTGDTLRICTGPAGGARPAEFASEKGDGRSYTVWRRP